MGKIPVTGFGSYLRFLLGNQSDYQFGLQVFDFVIYCEYPKLMFPKYLVQFLMD